jgi:hypothetical protein
MKKATRKLSSPQIHNHKNAYYLSPQITAELDSGRGFYVITLESDSGIAAVFYQKSSLEMRALEIPQVPRFDSWIPSRFCVQAETWTPKQAFSYSHEARW